MCRNFIEVYVKASLKECERRDPKGLYHKARLGQIKNFTGIDDPYEAPMNPDVIVNTEQNGVDDSFEYLKDKLNKFYFLKV